MALLFESLVVDRGAVSIPLTAAPFQLTFYNVTGELVKITIETLNYTDEPANDAIDYLPRDFKL